MPYFGNGDRTFQRGDVTSVDGFGLGLSTADFNGDGVPDIIISANEFPPRGAKLLMLLGDGNGGFEPPLEVQKSQAAGYGSPIVIGDLNGDGLPDFLMMGDNDITQYVTVWLNVSTPPALHLDLVRNQENLTFSWSGTSGYTLESCVDLGAPAWKPVAAQAVPQEQRWHVTLPLEQGNAYFRLRR